MSTVLELRCNLKENRGLSNSRLTADEDHRTRDYSAAEHEVEFGNSRFPSWLGRTGYVAQLARDSYRTTFGESLVSTYAARRTAS